PNQTLDVAHTASHSILPPTLIILIFSLSCCLDHRDLHSFPTRRSSDLNSEHRLRTRTHRILHFWRHWDEKASVRCSSHPNASKRDRKSTRLNSSHDQISYAVFCLKKKKNHPRHQP